MVSVGRQALLQAVDLLDLVFAARGNEDTLFRLTPPRCGPEARRACRLSVPASSPRAAPRVSIASHRLGILFEG